MNNFIWPYLTPAILTDFENGVIDLLEQEEPSTRSLIEAAKGTPFEKHVIQLICDFANARTGAQPPAALGMRSMEL